VISVTLKTHLEIKLGNCIYKTSLLHRPDYYIGFTPSCPPAFYNKIAPMAEPNRSSPIFESLAWHDHFCSRLLETLL